MSKTAWVLILIGSALLCFMALKMPAYTEACYKEEVCKNEVLVYPLANNFEFLCAVAGGVYYEEPAEDIYRETCEMRSARLCAIRGGKIFNPGYSPTDAVYFKEHIGSCYK